MTSRYFNGLNHWVIRIIRIIRTLIPLGVDWREEASRKQTTVINALFISHTLSIISLEVTWSIVWSDCQVLSIISVVSRYPFFSVLSSIAMISRMLEINLLFESHATAVMWEVTTIVAGLRGFKEKKTETRRIQAKAHRFMHGHVSDICT